HKRDNSLAFQLIRPADHRCFGYSWVAHERAFYFRCAKSVARYVENIINAANDPEIAVFIAARAVAGEIIALEFVPVLLPVARLIAVDGAQHCRPRPANN